MEPHLGRDDVGIVPYIPAELRTIQRGADENPPGRDDVGIVPYIPAELHSIQRTVKKSVHERNKP